MRRSTSEHPVDADIFLVVQMTESVNLRRDPYFDVSAQCSAAQPKEGSGYPFCEVQPNGVIGVSADGPLPEF